MNKKQSKYSRLYKYDIAFINPCIDRVLEALEELNNGMRVLLVFENQLNRNDSFQFTEIYPKNAFDFPQSIRKIKNWNKLFLLVPHLIQPQKVIYSNGKRNRIFAGITDWVFKNEFTKKTEFIDRKKPESLSFLRNDKIKGVVFQEYKINVSRIFIELLKFFEAKEGEIIFRDSFHSEEIAQVIRCNPIRKRSFIIPIDVPLNFSMVSQLN